MAKCSKRNRRLGFGSANMSGRLQSASLFLNANPIVAWNFVADILRYERVQKEDLTSVRVSRMLNLMRASYDDVTLERFVRDLSWKDEVILLLDDACEIQGFSTLALNPRGTGRDNYDILYSGDTIIGPDHWGSQELVRGFCETAGQIRAKRRKTLYWYLLSKGVPLLPLSASVYAGSFSPLRRRQRPPHIWLRLSTVAHGRSLERRGNQTWESYSSRRCG